MSCSTEFGKLMFFCSFFLVSSADARYDDESPQMQRLSLPSMQLQNHDSPKTVSIQVTDFSYREEIACNEDEPTDKTKNVNACQQENAHGHIPTFEEETGGLTPSMTEV